MIHGQNVFDQPVRNDLITYDGIRKIATGQGYDYATGCLLDYNYFEKYCKTIAIDLSKQQALDTEQAAIFFIIEEAKETVLDFSQGTVKVFELYFLL